MAAEHEFDGGPSTRCESPTYSEPGDEAAVAPPGPSHVAGGAPGHTAAADSDDVQYDDGFDDAESAGPVAPRPVAAAAARPEPMRPSRPVPGPGPSDSGPIATAARGADGSHEHPHHGGRGGDGHHEQHAPGSAVTAAAPAAGSSAVGAPPRSVDQVHEPPRQPLAQTAAAAAAPPPASPRDDYDDGFEVESEGAPSPHGAPHGGAGGGAAASAAVAATPPPHSRAPARTAAAVAPDDDTDYEVLGVPFVRNVPLRRLPGALATVWVSPSAPSGGPSTITLVARDGDGRRWRGEFLLDDVTRHCAAAADGGNPVPSVIAATRALNKGCTPASAAALLVAALADVDDAPHRVRTAPPRRVGLCA